ncbi:MAG TPA: aldo/keto reductase [Caulobacteraceae bacterium]|jgi:aryl-alcohol dehydrogenase-like predicted oxidoreductase
MNLRSLGRSGLSISPLVFGGNVFGWTADEATSHGLLDAFTGAGFNAVDTAEAYSSWVPGHKGGESETVIGTWLAKGGEARRETVIIATKSGWRAGDGPAGLLRADKIKAAVDASLLRLQTDYIDLHQTHSDDPDTPFEEIFGAYRDLIDAGKVRAVGASNISAARLQEALAVSAREGLPRYESVQPAYNLYQREIEADLLPVCRDAEVGVISYYGLAAGFLTGKYRTEADAAKSARGQGVVSRFLNAKGLKILAALDEVSHAVGATPAQVALAWIMAKPDVTAPIASATSVAQFEELARATELKLDDEAMAKLDAAGL